MGFIPLKDLTELGSDSAIEPPNGYWGYGRSRVAINVVDSTNLKISRNDIKGLSTGTPVGIRVSNSFFTMDRKKGGYPVVDDNDPPGLDWNSDISISDNSVHALSGLRIGYYIENQKDFTFIGNSSSGCASNRIIASKGKIEQNSLDCSLSVSKEATPACKRLVFTVHPMHWSRKPGGPWKYTSPPPDFNEYFPPAGTEGFEDKD